MRLALSPIQKATSLLRSKSIPFCPAAFMTRAGGLVLYSTLRAETLPLTTAFFHCSRGGKEADTFSAAPPAVWVVPHGRTMADASSANMQVICGNRNDKAAPQRSCTSEYKLMAEAGSLRPLVRAVRISHFCVVLHRATRYY